jgi:4'-phosphopantetheinyl transferase
MPLYKSIRIEPDIEIYLWKLEESETTLMQGIQLTPNSLSRYRGMRSATHRRGFLSIRHLLGLAGYSDLELHYHPNGKPSLEDGKYISISHSFDFTGIILSPTYQVGIDIELQRSKILRIANRFAAPAETDFSGNELELVQKLTKVWCAKEAIYKIMSLPGLSFLHQIQIDPFTEGNNKTTARVTFQDKEEVFEVFFYEFEGYTMGWSRKRYTEL